jgi:ubiquinone/menaquinone biosynthesis C-methylase UbiE
MRRSAELEMMDMPGQPRELLVDDLRNLRIINRYLGCYRNVERALARLIDPGQTRCFTLLDVGTGSGDIPVRIGRWARRQQIAAEISAVDREAIAVEQAAAQIHGSPEISLLRGDAMNLPFRAASFDYVLASQLLHHFADEQIIAALRAWARLARRAVIVNDLVRHPVAYHGIRVLAKGLTRNAMTFTDAPLSVRRSLTLDEWRALFRRADVGKFQVVPAFPFRVLGLIWPKN